MPSANRSRRHFLAGCLAAVAAWFLPWRKAVPAPPQAAPCEATVVSQRVRATESRYDVVGRLMRIVDRLPRNNGVGEDWA